MFTLDDVENFLEDVLAALKARKKVPALEAEVKTLRDELAAARVTQDFSAELDKLRAEKISLENQNTQLIIQRDNSRRELDASNAKISTLQIDLAAANDKISTLESANDTLSAELTETKNQRDNFRSELDTTKTQCNNLSKKYSELKIHTDELRDERSKLRSENIQLENTANYYRENYSELDAAYKIYLALDGGTRYDLAGIFGSGDSPAGFFSGAVQENHLAPFWDYVSRRTDNAQLQQLFDFCFDALNRGFREPPFTRLSTAAGFDFDEDFMSKTSYSAQLGRVAKVFFQGYRYSAGAVVKKSIVELA